MLEFDYFIERNDGKKISKYYPKFSKKLNNLSIISGPNDSGKSTLLNLIALGFFGLDNKNISPALKERMRSLIDSDHQKVKFEISLANKKNKIKIISKKEDLDSEEISIFEKEGDESQKRISRESFEKKYLLIYDIPDNPLGRIKELNNELNIRQRIMGERIKTLNSFLIDIIREINESKDPKKISELKISREKLSDLVKDLSDNISIKQNELKSLKIYTYCKGYIENQNIQNDLKNRLNNFNKTKKTNTRNINRLKNQEKQIVKDGNEILKSISNDLINIKIDIKKIFPSELKNVLRLWEGINIKEILFEKEERDILVKGMLEVEENILSEIREDNKNPDNDKANLFRDLIDVLSNYKDLNTIIPGTEKDIEDFIIILRKEYQKFESIQKINQVRKNILELIERVREKRNKFVFDYSDKLKEIEEDSVEDVAEIYEEFNDEDFEGIIADLNSKIKKSKDKFENCVINLGKLNISLSSVKRKLLEYENDNEYLSYRIMDEKELDQSIINLQKEVTKDLKDLEEKKFRLRRIDENIDRLEKMEPHKYQNYFNEINELFNRTQNLHQKILNDYNGYLNDLIKEKINIKNLGFEQIRYYEKVAIFLGRKIDEIYHEDRNYKISKIDVLSKTIVTNEDTIIKYTDLGTGQSQAAYLKGLLNLKDDNRLVIALIDEVAMMDSRSLNIVFDSLKKLDNEDKLLLGVVVQRSDELNIKPIN